VGGSIAAPALARVIAAADGDWRAGWYVVFAVAVAVALIALLFVKNRPSDCGQLIDGGAAGQMESVDQGRVDSAARAVYSTTERWTVRQAARTPALWLITGAAVGESSAATAAVAHAVPHLRDLGHTAAAAAAALSLFSICTIAGKLSVGFLCDRIEPRKVWVPCIVMMAVAILVATRAHSATAMFLFTGMLGFGSGAALTSWHATVANYFGPASFASILGAQMPFNNAMAAASPFLVGLVFDMTGSYTTAFYYVAACSAVAAVLLLAASPPRRKQQSA
jgi:sugar phosphate permease